MSDNEKEQQVSAEEPVSKVETPEKGTETADQADDEKEVTPAKEMKESGEQEDEDQKKEEAVTSKITEEKSLDDVIAEKKSAGGNKGAKSKNNSAKAKQEGSGSVEKKSKENLLDMALDDLVKAERAEKRGKKGNGKRGKETRKNDRKDEERGMLNKRNSNWNKQGGARNYSSSKNSYGGNGGYNNGYGNGGYGGNNSYGGNKGAHGGNQGYNNSYGGGGYYADNNGGGNGGSYYDNGGYEQGAEKYGSSWADERYQPYGGKRARYEDGGKSDMPPARGRGQNSRGRKRPSSSRPRRERSRGNRHVVRVSNVPGGVEAEDLERAFQAAGRVEACHAVARKSGEFLVTYASLKDAESAINKYDGGTLNSSRIKVALCG
ncbi:unnamed protein product [Amoebophrya sp. A25]|nr:unnamed protein product [Amoebophrya sp. A25]|eukprot:GSA25T00017897001.1